MKAIPAIDILGGQCVRLAKGDFAQATHYSSDPVDQARRFEQAGLSHLHMVDLDGAKRGEAMHLELLSGVTKETGLTVDFGGGISSLGLVKEVMACGARQITVGSVAVAKPDLFASWVHEIGAEHFVVALDVKEGEVAVKGWQEKSQRTLDDVIPGFLTLGVHDVLCTDISRDGMMSGPAIELYQTILAQHPTVRLWASGGIRSMDDLHELRKLGCHAAVVGRAIYEGAISINELAEFNAH